MCNECKMVELETAFDVGDASKNCLLGVQVNDGFYGWWRKLMALVTILYVHVILVLCSFSIAVPRSSYGSKKLERSWLLWEKRMAQGSVLVKKIRCCLPHPFLPFMDVESLLFPSFPIPFHIKIILKSNKKPKPLLL